MKISTLYCLLLLFGLAAWGVFELSMVISYENNFIVCHNTTNHIIHGEVNNFGINNYSCETIGFAASSDINILSQTVKRVGVVSQYCEKPYKNREIINWTEVDRINLSDSYSYHNRQTLGQYYIDNCLLSQKGTETSEVKKDD